MAPWHTSWFSLKEQKKTMMLSRTFANDVMFDALSGLKKEWHDLQRNGRLGTVVLEMLLEMFGFVGRSSTSEEL